MNELFRKFIVGITTMAMVITMVPIVPAVAETPAPAEEEAEVVLLDTITAYVTIGDTGSDVAALQAFLIIASEKVAEINLAADSPDVINAVYGEDTKAAVIALKKDLEIGIEARLTALGRQLDAEGNAQLKFTPFVGTATMGKVNEIIRQINAEIAYVPVVVTPTVAISAETPAARTIPKAATLVDVLAFELTAGTEDLEIPEMTFRRIGVGESADFDGFFIVKDGIRVNEHPRHLIEEEVEFIVLDITIPAGETASLVLKANIDDGARTGNESAFRITNINAGEVKVEGLPFAGNIQRIGAISVSEITLQRGSDIVNQVIGSEGIEIANFKIEADSPTLIQEILVSIRGTVSRGEVINLVLIHDGEPIATAVAVDARDRTVFIIEDGVEIAEGRTETFSIVADINPGRGADTVLVYISERADIIALDQNIGFGAIINLAVRRIGDQTLEGGDLVLHAKRTDAGEIARGGNNVVLAGARLLAERDIEIRDIVVELGGSILPAQVEDLRIINVDTGATLVRKADGLSIGDNTITGNLFVIGGQELTIAITVDIADDDAVIGKNIQATIKILDGTTEVRDLETGQVVADIINPTIISTIQVVVEAGATAALLAVPSDKIVITGQTEVPAIGFRVAATGADVTLDSVNATINVNTASDFRGTSRDAATVVTQARLMKLMEDGITTTELDTSTPRDNKVVFDGFSLAIAADGSKDLIIELDFASGQTTQHYVAVTITDIDVVDANNDAVTVIGENINPLAGGDTLRVTTVATAGTLAVTEYVDQPDATIIPVGVTGAVGVNFVTAQLDASQEAMIVEEVKVTRAGTNIGALSRAELFFGGGVVASKTFIQGVDVLTFRDLNIRVPIDETPTLTARATTFGIGYGAGSGNAVSLNLAVTEAIGVHSSLTGITRADTDGTIAATNLTGGVAMVDGAADVTIGGAVDAGVMETITVIVGGQIASVTEAAVNTWTTLDLAATAIKVAIEALPAVYATVSGVVVTIHNETTATLSLATSASHGLIATAVPTYVPGDVPTMTPATGTITIDGIWRVGDKITVNVGDIPTDPAPFVVTIGRTSIADVATDLAAEITDMTTVATAVAADGVITITGTDHTDHVVVVTSAGPGAATAIIGNTMTLRQTVPTVATVKGATTHLRTGENHLMTVTVVADAKGDVILETLGVNLAFTGVAVSDIIVRSGGVDVPDTAIAEVDGNNVIAFTTAEIIAAGTSKTYEIFAVVVPAAVIYPVPDDVVGAGDSLSSQLIVAGFQWEDAMGNIADLDGGLIDELPSTLFTISFD